MFCHIPFTSYEYEMNIYILALDTIDSKMRECGRVYYITYIWQGWISTKFVLFESDLFSKVS